MGVTHKRKWCVYMHTNKHNNKVYVGITNKKCSERWGVNGSGYLKQTKQGRYHNPVMAKALKKYSDWNVDWDHIIFAENLAEEEAKHMEVLLIALYKTNCCKYKNPSYGYNMTDGGDGTAGYHHSAETRKKISQSNMGKPSHNKGKHLSDDIKNKISKSNQGKTMSDESRKKMSKAKQNLSEEARQNMSNAHDKTPVVQLTLDGVFIAEYNSIAEASRQTGVYRGSISASCQNKHCSAGGFIWKYKKQYNPDDKIVYQTRRTRPVIQLDRENSFICEYNSISDAARLTGVSSWGIRDCCSGRVKTAGGFKWKDKEVIE